MYTVSTKAPAHPRRPRPSPSDRWKGQRLSFSCASLFSQVRRSLSSDSGAVAGPLFWGLSDDREPRPFFYSVCQSFSYRFTGALLLLKESGLWICKSFFSLSGHLTYISMQKSLILLSKVLISFMAPKLRVRLRKALFKDYAIIHLHFLAVPRRAF